jgi:tRNA A37 N6-isopentenylltransferase MiaA
MGIVYTFIGVLTMQKEIKKLKADYRFLKDQMNLMDNEIAQRINRRDDLLNQRIDEVISNTQAEFAESHSYIDKRIDKTIDVLQGNINLVYKETEKLNS